MNFSLDDILDNLANRAFEHVVQQAQQRTCPRDGEVLVRLPSGMFFCERCTTKWAPQDQGQTRGRPLGGPEGSDAFRPFDPFMRERATRQKQARRPRKDDYSPPRPFRRPRPAPPPPPVVRREDEVGAAYQLLGLSPGADAAAVKARRRELALAHHPDRGGEKGKLARINAAADLLLEIL